jgi:hypothetical protein
LLTTALFLSIVQRGNVTQAQVQLVITSTKANQGANNMTAPHSHNPVTFDCGGAAMTTAAGGSSSSAASVILQILPVITSLVVICIF